MKQKLLVLLLITNVCLFSQTIPQITIDENQTLKLTHLSVTVDIIGNHATTTYDMKFYNELDRILEGELMFPLGEGQTVSAFAMEIEGKLRKAVVVEKELARVAYERTIRQNIDPGLLEQTQGNNYKARIYPINPQSYKRVVITFEQTIPTIETKQVYELPLGINKSLDKFNVTIKTHNEQKPNVRSKTNYKTRFKGKNGTYIAQIEKVKHTPLHPITIRIPAQIGEETIITYQKYFHYTKKLNPVTRLKKKPKSIQLIWDASYSMRYRNLDQEIAILDAYFDYLQNVTVTWMTFSNGIKERRIIEIHNGNWNVLKKQISKVMYDGGTSYNTLTDIAVTADEILFFTDGLSNLGSFEKHNDIPLYTINSVVSANHSTLNEIATQTGGNYINLIRTTASTAIKILKEEPYQFLGVAHGRALTEIYPNKRMNIRNDFSISGQFKKDTTFTMLFGYQDEIIDRIPVSIKTIQQTKEAKRLWAKQKLESLMPKAKEHKEAILTLGKEYQLITPYTSMIILDRIEDYVHYRIEPPKELRSAYKELLNNEKEEEKDVEEMIKKRRADLFEDYQEIKKWYVTEYPKNKKKKITDNSNNTQPIPETPVNTNHVAVRTNTVNDDDKDVIIRESESVEEEKRIEGTVVEFNEPLPGVNIIIKGTNRGTVTDFDGNFSILVNEGDSLIFSYVGFDEKEVIVTTTNTISVAMESNSSQLEEIVVTAMSAKKNAVLTQSVQEEVSIRGVASGVRGRMSNKENPQTTNQKSLNDLEKNNKDKIALKPWNPSTPYLAVLAQEETVMAAYKKYLIIREKYANSPSFYLDVADHFEKRNNPEIAITILTNLMEIELDNYELMKALGYKLEYFKQYKLAVEVYKKIVELRPEEPQSYRDLALAYEQVGAIQKSYDILFKLYDGQLLNKDEDERFYGIEHIAYIELTRLVNKYKNSLNINTEYSDFLTPTPVDIRIIIDWNHNDTDIDLWVFDPTGEKAFYSNPKTAIGGRMSEDLTDGYGPEEFMLKNAVKGTYKVKVNYFADRVQKISGPTIIKATFFIDYGKENERKKIKIIRLEDEEGEIEIGDLIFE